MEITSNYFLKFWCRPQTDVHVFIYIACSVISSNVSLQLFCRTLNILFLWTLYLSHVIVPRALSLQLSYSNKIPSLDFIVDIDTIKHSHYREWLFIEFLFKNKPDMTQCLPKIVERQYAKLNVQMKVIGDIAFVII